jgi:peptidoglycan/LPS O-acetylase OafA/YrhL
MPAQRYPQHIKPLTSLRFLAALWVLLYHFKDHLGLYLGRFGLIADGYLGVDLFFALSGFILAHVYLADLEAGQFGYAGFLKNRLARVYPMHLVALGAMLVLFAGASLLGVSESAPDSFKVSDLPAHLLLIHAWGTTQTVGWNFPSWSISAEWAAYLVFPFIAALVLKAQDAARALVVCALAMCLAAYAALDHLHLVLPWVGQDFSGMTAQIGALRIMPSFFMGVALYAFGRNHAAPKTWAWPIVLTSAAWIIAVCTLHLWQGLVWFGLAGLLYGLAETSRHQVDAPIAGKSFVFLGAASYALYMLHLPIDIVWFHALEKFGVTETAPLAVRALAVAGVFIACIAAASFAYLCIEEPARKYIRKLEFKPFPARQPSGAR